MRVAYITAVKWTKKEEKLLSAAVYQGAMKHEDLLVGFYYKYLPQAKRISSRANVGLAAYCHHPRDLTPEILNSVNRVIVTGKGKKLWDGLARTVDHIIAASDGDPVLYHAKRLGIPHWLLSSGQVTS